MQRIDNVLWLTHSHFMFLPLPHFSLLFWLRLVKIHGGTRNGFNFRLHSCSFLYLHNNFTCFSLCKGLSISLPTFLFLFFNAFLLLKIKIYIARVMLSSTDHWCYFPSEYFMALLIMQKKFCSAECHFFMVNQLNRAELI